MKHPFQSIAVDSSTSCIFGAFKNHIRAFKVDREPTSSVTSCTPVGSWDDEVIPNNQQATGVKKQEEGDAEAEVKTKKAKKAKKSPTVVPQPTFYIRTLDLFSDKYLVATTDNDKSIVIFEIDYSKPNCLVLLKRQQMPKRPCSVSMDSNFENVVVADKFGDVYTVPIAGESLQDEKTMNPILGHVSMLTDVLMTEKNGKQFILTADRDEHIRVSNYPKSYVVKHWLFSHNEYVSSMHIPSSSPDLLVSGGGDDFICLWNWYEGKFIDKVDIREHLNPFFKDFHNAPERFLTENSVPEISVSKILSLLDGYIIVLVENVNCLLLFKIENESEIVFKQTLTLPNPLVDISVYSDSQIVGSNDADEGDLVSIFELDDCLLKSTNASLADIKSIEVESRQEVSSLWYVNSLRKRSEH